MIRRRFLALAFVAVVSMHVPRPGWFGGEENNPELEGVIDWENTGGGIGRVVFDKPEGFDVLEASWDWGTPGIGWRRGATDTVTRVNPHCRTLAVPDWVGSGRVSYRWRRA